MYGLKPVPFTAKSKGLRKMSAGIGVTRRYRESATMLSRVADSLYWMSRYLERAENTTRQLDVTMSLMLDTGGVNVESRWKRMLASLGNPVELEWNGALEHLARALVFDSLNPASVTFCVN